MPKDKQEGGTYVIPGHGRLTDEADVVDYRDMVTIIRDRFDDAVKKGMTLDAGQGGAPGTGLRRPVWGHDRLLDDRCLRRSRVPEPPPAAGEDR